MPSRQFTQNCEPSDCCPQCLLLAFCLLSSLIISEGSISCIINSVFHRSGKCQDLWSEKWPINETILPRSLNAQLHYPICHVTWCFVSTAFKHRYTAKMDVHIHTAAFRTTGGYHHMPWVSSQDNPRKTKYGYYTNLAWVLSHVYHCA